MNRKTYVKRLKRMFERYSDAPCSHCPVAKHYSGQPPAAWEGCEMCQKFVGLRVVIGGTSKKRCPCFRPGPERAIKRALKYIALYEAKHGEV